MERSLRKYDQECMKVMILKHEETFKQQVNELHRLYQIQKLLMRDMENSELKRQRFNLGEQKSGTDPCLPSNIYCDLRRRRRMLNLELPADEYIERAEEDVMLEVEEGGDIELRLTKGRSWSKMELPSLTSESAASFTLSSTESNIRYCKDTKNHFEFEGLGDVRLKQSSWHFQCLSLKMT